MAFLQDSDYKPVITTDDLDTIMQSDSSIRTSAEDMAKEQMIGYLSGLYDTDAIFAEAGQYSDTRNKMIVMCMVDIAVYHMHSQLPEKMGLEVRRTRYEDALKWLKAVANGDISPDLPAADPEPDTTNWGSETRQKYDW